MKTKRRQKEINKKVKEESENFGSRIDGRLVRGSKRRIVLGREAMMELDKNMKDKDISFKTKKRIIDTLVIDERSVDAEKTDQWEWPNSTPFHKPHQHHATTFPQVEPGYKITIPMKVLTLAWWKRDLCKLKVNLPHHRASLNLCVSVVREREPWDCTRRTGGTSLSPI
ncbi:hypothetical protein LAZ67_17003099 [Cordylochernes scorpioides]|uniref:Uncharacterized protein n=1 Tax=Cordylochernes scorpioides TaxID=51811 RepID=A0ABY6LEF6_9ARAC|nr:hypothetical protein LAZ67_17003099 [Cordylochernes scorpioides]